MTKNQKTILFVAIAGVVGYVAYTKYLSKSAAPKPTLDDD